MSEFLAKKLEAVEKQRDLLKVAIKKTWVFIKYHLPLSVELEVSQQPKLRKKVWSQTAFQPLLDLVLNTAVEVMQETNSPFHYKTVEDLILKRAEDDEEIGGLLNRYKNPDLPRRVRELRAMDYLVGIGNGMYFYGPKLAEKQEVKT